MMSISPRVADNISGEVSISTTRFVFPEPIVTGSEDTFGLTPIFKVCSSITISEAFIASKSFLVPFNIPLCCFPSEA